MWPGGQVWKPGPPSPATVAALPPAWWFRMRIFCSRGSLTPVAAPNASPNDFFWDANHRFRTRRRGRQRSRGAPATGVSGQWRCGLCGLRSISGSRSIANRCGPAPRWGGSGRRLCGPASKFAGLSRRSAAVRSPASLRLQPKKKTEPPLADTWPRPKAKPGAMRKLGYRPRRVCVAPSAPLTDGVGSVLDREV